jgi:DNA end-binding protein Ku
MPRSIWNGVISFGMVSIPVKLFTGTESKDISFNQLHKDDNVRIKMVRWCPEDDRALEMGEIVRGYEYARDQYVILTEEDFEKLPLPSKHTIELAQFVAAEEIDPVYYEKTYYLEPDEKGVKPYSLLMRALKEKGLTAVAKIAIRNKERLCALRPMDGTLVLETLFYPDEIRVQKESDIPEVEVSDRELDMAFTLIDLLHEPFDPERFKDEYREALMQLIDAKLEGQELAVVTAQPAKVTDLMTALKASVAAAKKRRAGGEEEEAEAEAKEPTPIRRKKAATG